MDKERLGFHEEFLLIEFYQTFFEFLAFDMANQISSKYEQIDFPLISFVGFFFLLISSMKSTALRVLLSNKFNSRWYAYDFVFIFNFIVQQLITVNIVDFNFNIPA